jgi:hypothetical protein
LSQDSAGLVGVGTAVPAKTLHVAKTNAYAARIGGASFYWDMGQYASDSSPRLDAIGTSASAIFAVNGTEHMRITDAGLVGVGATPVTKLTVEGSVTLKEQAAADSDTAAYGQIWVKTGTPNTLWFTDDAGTDAQLGAGGGGGKILQVLNNTAVPGDVTDDSYTSAVAQAITPADTGNKVLLTAAANFKVSYDDNTWEDGYLMWRLYRDSVALGTEQHYINNDDDNFYDKYFSCSFTFLDSPSSTSAVTYSLKYMSYYSSDPEAHIYDAQITVQEVD